MGRKPYPSSLCIKCGINPRRKHKALCPDCDNEIRRAKYKEKPDKYKQESKDFRAKRKLIVLAEYGGKCVCCGETNPGFLNIDHVNGGGNSHRRQIGQVNFYDWLKQQGYPKEEFQILCYNCNLGRHHNGGICPHKGYPQ